MANFVPLGLIIIVGSVLGDEPIEGSVRLLGGTTKCEGNVEIFHNRQWGSVCQEKWDDKEAHVVCHQLGYQRHIRSTNGGRFGQSYGQTWIDNVACVGNESGLTDCSFSGWRQHDCNSPVGVVCECPRLAAWIKEKPISVRLAGGRNVSEGRVEVNINDGQGWGTICTSEWTFREGNVICRQLSLGYAVIANLTAIFGTSPRILFGTKCQGNEATLAKCRHENSPPRNCQLNNRAIAAVRCESTAPDLILEIKQLEQTARLESEPMGELECAMEEKCLSQQSYRIQATNPNWRNSTRNLLRFTTTATNIGTADFNPYNGREDWVWHKCHDHFHSMEVFATFDVYDRRGLKIAQGHKASYCLEDSKCNPGGSPKYTCDEGSIQGISTNCSDVYAYSLDCQWVDVSELAPNREINDFYILRVVINPQYMVGEISYENNAAECKLYYTGSPNTTRVWDCTNIMIPSYS